MDLLSHLLESYKESYSPEKTTEAKKQKILLQVEEFVKFAKKYLGDHPPVTFDFLSHGTAVTLSNGERLTFVEQDESAEFVMNAGEVPVTTKNRDSKFANWQ